MERKATAHWTGGLKEGKGTISSESGVLENTQYSFKTRFEQGKGTNPEELIAAAHAGCFTMALSGQLEKEGIIADSLITTASVTFEKSGDGFAIPAIHLTVKAKITKGDKTLFAQAAENAKRGCPVSKLLNATITMDASLE